ncbi:MAG: Stp1/IreP family PP2C-type Ser/Thr phosphatase [Lachnospiraceae bacterium]|nr:Stp1/IreP family PP2C-type Ser/Thr phosphatase [Lachnospiraceae bacterium]MBP3610894.1 Stp1/IreP family PP2C-type Ser/Thr phosphatase [Lachnospiraceae bacterium]
MESFAITDIGSRREVNQDFVYCNDNAVGLLPNLYIVADGMGGHRAGDFASRFSVNEFEKEIKEQKARTIIGSMEGAIRLVNERLLKEAASDPAYEGMGTTFVAATMTADSLYVANIGDSRLYMIYETGEIRQITQDHSLVEQKILRGELDRKDAKNHPEKNVITRALGAMEQVVPDFFEVELEAGVYILLCSDGLTNMVEDHVIREMVLSQNMGLKEKAERLVALANENGGRDNISLILVHI